MLFVFSLFRSEETKDSRKIPTEQKFNQRRLYKYEGSLPRINSILIDFSFCFDQLCYYFDRLNCTLTFFFSIISLSFGFSYLLFNFLKWNAFFHIQIQQLKNIWWKSNLGIKWIS